MSILSSSSSLLVGFCDAHKHASSSSVICCSFLTPLSVPHPKPKNKNKNNKKKKLTQICTDHIAVGFQGFVSYPWVFLYARCIILCDDLFHIFWPFDYCFKYAAKARYPIRFRAQYMLSTTSHSTSTPTATLLDMEELSLPSLTVNSDSLIVNRPWTYTGAIAPPTEVRAVISEFSCGNSYLWI